MLKLFLTCFQFSHPAWNHDGVFSDRERPGGAESQEDQEHGPRAERTARSQHVFRHSHAHVVLQWWPILWVLQQVDFVMISRNCTACPPHSYTYARSPSPEHPYLGKKIWPPISGLGNHWLLPKKKLFPGFSRLIFPRQTPTKYTLPRENGNTGYGWGGGGGGGGLDVPQTSNLRLTSQLIEIMYCLKAYAPICVFTIEHKLHVFFLLHAHVVFCFDLLFTIVNPNQAATYMDGVGFMAIGNATLAVDTFFVLRWLNFSVASNWQQQFLGLLHSRIFLHQAAILFFRVIMLVLITLHFLFNGIPVTVLGKWESLTILRSTRPGHCLSPWV